MQSIIEVLVENDVFMVAKIETTDPLSVRFLNLCPDGVYRYEAQAEEIPLESINAYGDTEADFGYIQGPDGTFTGDDESDPDYEPETESDSESESLSDSEDDE
jgi:hypothetical protein